MAIPVLIVILIFALYGSSKADVVVPGERIGCGKAHALTGYLMKKDERSASRTSAEAMSTSFVSMTTKGPDFPTPITTALPTSFIPLYVPQVDPNGGPQPLQVDYLGAANGGSTIYQVVMQGHLTEYREYSPHAPTSSSPNPSHACPAAVTATLFEDASNAKLLGGQQILTIDGMATAVYAAASCGFQDGLHSATASKAAGICYYWHAIDHSTSTWASAM